MRFVGIDGPRWFVRAMFVGPVATDRTKAAPLERILRNALVYRGATALPVREPVPLQMPRDVALPGAPRRTLPTDESDSF